MSMLALPGLLLLGLLLLHPAAALQTTQCDTSEGERAVVMRRAMEHLDDEYEIIEGKLSFPRFAQPAGRYGLISFDGKEVNPPTLCSITNGVHTPYGAGLCNYTFVLTPRVGRVCFIEIASIDRSRGLKID